MSSKHVREADINKLAKRFIRHYAPTLDEAYIAGYLQALGNYIFNDGDAKNEPAYFPPLCAKLCMVMKMNRLQFEKSPYLLQHAGNPVHWRPWGSEAFAIAETEDKPVFLSIGYSTCHWCHVMAHDSFEDAQVAAELNRDFIPVKVDREERPDVDAVYMEACLAMNGSGGWPLTVLLAPDQRPFWAGTYLPKGQLLALLNRAAALWQNDRESLLAVGEKLTEMLRRSSDCAGQEPTRALVEAGFAAFSRSFDREWGGFGRAPKFPSGHNLLFLLRYAEATGAESARQMAERTLEAMYRGGIFDHIGGGFCRYATDRRWLVPHFEKMLYDNALLALSLTEAWRAVGSDWMRRAAMETLDYVLRELRDPPGGFYCGQDADSDGVEGKYYVFTPEELRTLFGDDASAFCTRFGITAQGNFHGKSIPNLIDAPAWAETSEKFEAMRRKAAVYRRERTALRRDDKVLTAWNSLMIAALARAGLAFGETRYTSASTSAAAFLREKLSDRRGRLLARWCDGEAAHPGKLDDYAFFAWGLLELYSTTMELSFLEDACRVCKQLLEQFFDAEHGGCFPYAADGEQLITRKKDAYDGAMPSGNAVAALVLSRLWRLTGEERWREAAALQVRWLTGQTQEQPQGHGLALYCFVEALWSPGELVCASREIPAELLPWLREKAPSGMAVLVKTEKTAERLAKIAPFTAAYLIPETGVRYYLCKNGTCRQPLDSLTDLE